MKSICLALVLILMAGYADAGVSVGINLGVPADPCPPSVNLPFALAIPPATAYITPDPYLAPSAFIYVPAPPRYYPYYRHPRYYGSHVEVHVGGHR